jgi:hypothetical protein
MATSSAEDSQLSSNVCVCAYPKKSWFQEDGVAPQAEPCFEKTGFRTS